MDLSVNNVSFQGNLLTRVKGNNDILDLVKKEFAKQTKSVQGNLRMSRTFRHYEPESFDFNYRRVDLTVTSGIKELISKDPRFLTKDGIAAITSEFVGIFKAMKIQNEYIKKMAKTHKKYANARSEIKRIAYEQFKAERMGMQSLAQRYSQTLDKYRSIADSAWAKMVDAYDKTIVKMDDFRKNVIGNELKANVPHPKELYLYYKE